MEHEHIRKFLFEYKNVYNLPSFQQKKELINYKKMCFMNAHLVAY